MNIEELVNSFPHVDVRDLYPLFPRISVADYPALRSYSWEQCHEGFMGAGGLFLTLDLARALDLKPGSRVLDLCCGNCSSSIFLASHYGVNVVALDRAIEPKDNSERIRRAGVADLVHPVRADARNLPQPEGYFDAVFCMNSYFYFGTEDTFLPQLLGVLTPGGRIAIGSPCYSHELRQDTPREFLYDAPEFAESRAVHSPPWWRDRFEESGLVITEQADEHPLGREFWLDDVRWILESMHPRELSPAMQEMLLQQIVMLAKDTERFVTYLTVVVRKK